MNHRVRPSPTLSCLVLAAALWGCGSDATQQVVDASTADVPAGDLVSVDIAPPAVQPICPPGQTLSTCPGSTTVTACSADGSAWAEQACPDGEFCFAGRCEAYPCAPGTVRCDDPKHRVACLSDGADGFEWAPFDTCQGVCRDGECIGACGFDIKQNDGEGCEHFVLELEGTPDSSCSEEHLLVVPSSGADALSVFDLDAEPPQALPGSPFPTCSDPSRVLLDRHADIVATCRGDGRVVKHASGGEVLWDVTLPECTAVRGAVVGPDDRLFVGCTNTGRVHELDPDTGDVLDTVATGVDVYGLGVDAGGVYATDFGNLAKVRVEGGLKVVWKVAASGYGIAADGAGRVWLAESPGLVGYSAADGTPLVTVPIVGPEPFESGHCNGVAIGPRGRVHVGCAESGDYVAIYDPEADALELLTLPSGASHPRGVAVDAAGDLLTINLDSNNVTRFDALTRQATTFGSGALQQPYGYSGDMTGLSACRFAGRTTWLSEPVRVGDGATRWLTVRWRATVPEGTSLEVSFRLDGGPWVEVLDGMAIDAVAEELQLRVVLASSREDAAPTLHELAVYHSEAP